MVKGCQAGERGKKAKTGKPAKTAQYIFCPPPGSVGHKATKNFWLKRSPKIAFSGIGKHTFYSKLAKMYQNFTFLSHLPRREAR